MSPSVAILGTRYSDFSIEEAILGPHGVTITAGDGGDARAVIEQGRGATVVLAGSGPRFDRAVISELHCKGIVRYGVGTETIDLEAAADAGVWVSYVPDYATDAVATHTVTMLLAALRRLVAADLIVRSGGWGIGTLRPLRAPSALTVGVVGFGRIGRRVAELLGPFGFRLTAFDPLADASDSGVELVELDKLLEVSDIVTLHATAARDGGPLLGPEQIQTMKSGALVINTARGALLDYAALFDALRAGRLGGVALDVFPSEPPHLDLTGVEGRVTLSPHMAWYTEESESDLRSRAAHEALRIIEGREPSVVAARPRRLR